VLDHLAIAFPELSEAERRDLARGCFRHVGLSAAELLHLWGRRPDYAERHVRIEGFEVIEALRREKRPIFILTGHCGNWELISIANLKHQLGLSAMAREVVGAAQVAEDLRAHLGTISLPRGKRRAVSGMLRVLRSGGALGMLIDQDFETDGVWVPFFGKLAFTPTAGAGLALRLGAAVVPTFAERLEDGSHRVRFHPPLDLPDNVTGATAIMTRAIEEQIRRRPEQWVWMHRRWRRRPLGESEPPVDVD
jgi:KDO2-lipid IV(A) lauroyltransferase